MTEIKCCVGCFGTIFRKGDSFLYCSTCGKPWSETYYSEETNKMITKNPRRISDLHKGLAKLLGNNIECRCDSCLIRKENDTN